MKLKDLLNVIDTNALLNIVSGARLERHWLFMDKAVFITSDLLERTIIELDIIHDEFYIVLED